MQRTQMAKPQLFPVKAEKKFEKGKYPNGNHNRYMQAIEFCLRKVRMIDYYYKAGRRVID